MLSLALGSLGVIIAVPISGLIWKYGRIYWYGAEVRFSSAMSTVKQISAPLIAYKNMVLPSSYLTRVLELETFEVRSDDIYVAGFARSGTTWTQELVYLIASGADTTKASFDDSHRRVPSLEDIFEFDLENFNKRPSPRVFKTHLHYPLLPAQFETKRPKIIYLMRNPKDVSVSFFHILGVNKKNPVKDDFDLFLDNFINNKLIYTSWPEHIKGFWNRRHQENILILKYEDMLQDVDGTVRKMASFLEKPLTDEQLTAIIQHCCFDKMQQNDRANGIWLESRGLVDFKQGNFIRKGKIGTWKKHYTPEQSARMDKMVKDGLGDTGIKFTYEHCEAEVN